MASSNFVDYVKIFCRSGKGGNGAMHFNRAKYVPKGGPDGGDGGKGGDVILRGNAQLWTLLHLRYTKHLFAGDGEPGGSNQRTGANGNDVIIEVPLGSMAYDAETREPLGEVTEDGQEIVIMKGGRGGKGNTFFKTATLQAPKFSQPGEPSIERWIIIELKMLDVAPCKNAYCGIEIHLGDAVLNKGRCCFIDISVYCCRHVCSGLSALRRFVNACCKRQNQQHRRRK